MLFSQKILLNINVWLILLFVILLTKSLISYTEELFLISFYISLFSVLLVFTGNIIRLSVIEDAFILTEFYEKFLYVTMALNLHIRKILNLLKIVVYLKFKVNLINYAFLKIKKTLKKHLKVLKLNFIYLYLNDIILNLNTYILNIKK